MIHYDWKKCDSKDVFRTNLAIDFLNKERNTQKPLFLVMSYRTPHAHEPNLRETENNVGKEKYDAIYNQLKQQAMAFLSSTS